MPGLNRNKNNRIDNILIYSIIREVFCYTNNILIVNNIGYSKELSMIANFVWYLKLSKKNFYPLFCKQNCTEKIIS